MVSIFLPSIGKEDMVGRVLLNRFGIQLDSLGIILLGKSFVTISVVAVE